MLDKTTKTIAALGAPATLRDTSENPWVRAFLSRDGLKSEDKADVKVKIVE